MGKRVGEMAGRIFINIIRCALMLTFLAALPGTSALAGGFVEINVYPVLNKVDSDTAMTVNTGGKLSRSLSYFGFVNIARKIGERGNVAGVTYFSEQNLRWRFSEDLPLQIAFQGNFRTGDKNDRYRIGLRWLVNETSLLKALCDKISLSYAVTLFPVQFDHEEAYVWMIEHSYRMTFPWLTDRLYLAGFVDHTFNEDLPDTFPSDPVVTETQFGLRLVDQLHLTAEYRINEYRRSRTTNFVGGLEYKIRW